MPPAETDPWDGYVRLPENRSAVSAVARVRKGLARGRCRLPIVVVHGSPGSGKTRLAQAAAAGIEDALIRPAADLARPARSRGTIEHDPDLDQAPLLILEDVHRLPPRGAEALTLLLDRRATHRRPTIFTSIVGPALLSDLPRRLTNRLAAGLVVPLDPPAAASRRKLLRAFAAAKSLKLSLEATDWLAQSVALAEGIRPLVGAVDQLAVQARGRWGRLERADVERLMKGRDDPPGEAAIVRLTQRVADAFQIEFDDLTGLSRLKSVMLARQVAMASAREVLNESLPSIGRYFGKDHSTVLHACRKVKGLVKKDRIVAGIMSKLKAEWQNG